MWQSMTAAAVLTGMAASAFAQSPASSFDRGSSRQAWQEPRLASIVAGCKVQPPPFAIGGAQQAGAATADSQAPPPEPPPPPAATG